MGDHTTETLQLQNHRDNERCSQYLGGPRLALNENSLPWIVNHIDCFVSQSRGNMSVENVVLYPYSVNGHNYEAVNGHDYEALNKVGQAIGNLLALKTLCIASENYHDVGYSSDEEDDEGYSSNEEDDEGDSSGEDTDEVVPPAPILDFEILARILSHVRQGITIDITNALAWDAEESRSFVRAIYGHPTITGFEAGRNFPYKSLDALYAALATLPALQSIRLRKRQIRTEDESTLAHPESLTELLRVPSLRSVGFDFFDFTPALSQATANALMEGTVITRLEFIRCSFCTQEGVATMANALTRNRSVTYIEVESLFFGTLNDALTAALPLNTTWRDLVLSGKIIDDDADFSPVVLALGKNTALKTLTIGAFGSMDESLCTAMQDGLEINETLSSLELNHCLCGENPELWCRALSFLRTNTALKSLTIAFNMDSTKSCVDTLCGQIATMLQENSSLESLNIQKSKAIMIKAEEYLFLVTTLQHNTTLKALDVRGYDASLTLTHNEEMQMAALLKKNYALEWLPVINLKNRGCDIRAILRLNGAGRRYLVQDGASVSKGVEVLSRVKNDINCVFLHLLENPRLCDRSAVEKVSAGESNGRSTNESGC